MKDLNCKGTPAEAHYFTAVMYQSSDLVVNGKVQGFQRNPAIPLQGESRKRLGENSTPVSARVTMPFTRTTQCVSGQGICGFLEAIDDEC